VAEQVEQQLVQGSLFDALELASLEAIAEPDVDAPTPAAGTAFRYQAWDEVRPAIALPELEGLPARRPAVAVADADVQRELEALQLRQAPLIEETEGTRAARGHVVVIDYQGTIEGVAFEGGTASEVEVELGAGRLVPGFEEQLEGAASGERRELRVRFPEDYANQELAGRDAVFAAQVHSIKRRELPALDDEFAKDLGDFENFEALRDRIRGDLLAMRERASRAALHRSLLDALLERTSFEVPRSLTERQLEQRLRSARQRFEGANLDARAIDAQLARWRDEWREPAEREVREMLLLDAIARANALAPDEAEIEARIGELAAAQGVSPAVLRQAYGEEAVERMARSQLADEKALEFLASRAKVEETTAT
jgi:trigger factor